MIFNRINWKRYGDLGFLNHGVAAIGFWMLIGCGCGKPSVNSSEEPIFASLSDTVGYVGMQTCRGCHEDKFKGFSETGMGHSFAKATKEKSAGDFDGKKTAYDPFKQLYYKPFWRSDSLFVKEFSLSGSDTLFQRTERIDYIVGSGQHTNSHIIYRNGYLFQAPFTYYSQSGKVDLPPGFADNNNSRFSRELGMECISCHNGYPEHVSGSVNKFSAIPQGIDCERCHGPGQAHVDKINRGELTDLTKGTDYSIVNPRKLDFERQKDVCQRCHLQGNALLKEGKSWKDFRPGMHLDEVMDVFMPQMADPNGQMIMASHPDRLRLSKCFSESINRSNGQLTCITCHNPHQSVQKTKRETFISQCVACHTAPEKECKEPENTRLAQNNDCINCHMKRSGTVDIPHVTITDHLIRIYKEDDQPLEGVELDKDFTSLAYLGRTHPGSATWAKAYLNFYEKFSRQPRFLDSAWHHLKLLPANGFFELWIQYYFLKKQSDKVVIHVERFYSEGQDLDATACFQIAETYQQLGDADKALSFAKNALRQQPLNPAYGLLTAKIYIHLHQPLQAEKLLLDILKEQPQNEAAINDLSALYLSIGNTEMAEKYVDQLLRLSPISEIGLINQIKLKLLQHKKSEATVLYNRFVQQFPKSPALKALALLMKNQ